MSAEQLECHNPPDIRPFFLPADLAFESLSAETQLAFTAFVVPAYQELVLAEKSPLLRITAEVVVFLHWLVLLDQLQIGSEFAESGGSGKVSVDLTRHLRLVSAFHKSSGFLDQLRRAENYQAAIQISKQSAWEAMQQLRVRYQDSPYQWTPEQENESPTDSSAGEGENGFASPPGSRS